MWAKVIVAFISIITLLHLIRRNVKAEEEGEEYYGGGGEWIPTSVDELEKKWIEFAKRFPCSLYCIVLASDSDAEIVPLVENHRLELAEISGTECCFVYFRDIEKAKILTPYKYSEHAKWVYPIANLLEIDHKLVFRQKGG